MTLDRGTVVLVELDPTLGHDGPAVVIVPGGGTKMRQARDIADAQARRQDYKRRR